MMAEQLKIWVNDKFLPSSRNPFKLDQEQREAVDKFLEKINQHEIIMYDIDTARIMLQSMINLHMNEYHRKKKTSIEVSEVYQNSSIMGSPYLVTRAFSIKFANLKSSLLQIIEKYYRNILTGEYSHQAVFNKGLAKNHELKETYLSFLAGLDSYELGLMIETSKLASKFYSESEVKEIKSSSIQMPVIIYDGIDERQVSEIITLKSLTKDENGHTLPKQIELSSYKKNREDIKAKYVRID